MTVQTGKPIRKQTHKTVWRRKNTNAITTDDDVYKQYRRARALFTLSIPLSRVSEDWSFSLATKGHTNSITLYMLILLGALSTAVRAWGGVGAMWGNQLVEQTVCQTVTQTVNQTAIKLLIKKSNTTNQSVNLRVNEKTSIQQINQSYNKPLNQLIDSRINQRPQEDLWSYIQSLLLNNRTEAPTRRRNGHSSLSAWRLSVALLDHSTTPATGGRTQSTRI